MTKPYVVSVDFNFDGQKNKYKEELEELKIKAGWREDPMKPKKSSNHHYDFKATFAGIKPGDILVVKCATGLQVVQAKKVSFPDTVPDHATARIIAKLDLNAIENMEKQAEHYEQLLADIEREAKLVRERKFYKKLAKESPRLAALIQTKELIEGNAGSWVTEREGE